MILSLLAIACGIFAIPAQAQDDIDRDDRFTLRLSAFYPEASLGLSTEGRASNGSESVDFGGSETAHFGNVVRPRATVAFRISERQALVGNYYDYSDEEDFAYGGGTIGSIEVPVLTGSGEATFSLASLNYEYSFVRTEAFEWGAGIGVTYAKLELEADAATTPTDDLVQAQSASLRWKEDGYSPGVHTRLTWRPHERWRVDLEGQYLDTSWGDILEEEGHFERGGLVVEYLLNDRLGIHVGYDWFRLKLEDAYSDEVSADEVGLNPVRIAGRIEGDLKVHGPMAGLTFRF